MKRIYLLLALAFIALSQQTRAKTSLPSFFSDGMVLQQKSKVRLWGTTDAKQNIIIKTSWDDKSYTVTIADNGSWSADIKTPVAGGPFNISINDGESLNLNNVLIGEVWLAAGQSNMEMPLKGFPGQPVANSDSLINEKTNNNIRFFVVKNNSWKRPLSNCAGQWQEANSQNRPDFGATAYLFAKNLQEKLNVPVGILEADWGGTMIQPWMNRAAVKEVSADIMIPDDADSANVGKNTPCGLFNAMINPLVGYRIKGAIWYQGEQNRPEPELYSRLFPSMVKHWRSLWGQGDFPFYYVQIAPFLSKREEPNKDEILVNPFVPYLREAQLNALSIIPNTGMAVLTDIGSEHVIHPPDKQSVADRLAALAYGKTYSLKDIAFESPRYESFKIAGNKLILKFRYTENGLQLRSGDSPNFEIAGKDKLFYPARITVYKDRLVLISDKVEQPVAARYGFHAWVSGDLFNSAGLPVSSFRTDNWPLPQPLQ